VRARPHGNPAIPATPQKSPALHFCLRDVPRTSIAVPFAIK
jgi:hypothetical protein